MEPDPKLLSLLEKVNNPIETLTIHLTIKVIRFYYIKRVFMDLLMIGGLQMKLILEYLLM